MARHQGTSGIPARACLRSQSSVDCGGSSHCRQADYYDSLATTSKRQFPVPFNRVMRAYGARQYQETDF